jgi:hypothetical protein
MTDIPTAALVSEQAILAGVTALEQIHGRHLEGMTADEQETARGHWRDQVEQVLHAVGATLAAAPGLALGGGGSAVLTFADQGGDDVEVSASFHPELRDLGDGSVEGTAAQVLALTALQAIEDDMEDENG